MRILWADDEIELLRPHILYLESKGYDVTSVSNGSDAIDRVKSESFEMVILDEQMPGIDGLATLAEINRLSPELPVVMITKSEEERIMEEALGRKISDYLTKPVNPSQVLLTCKRILDRNRLQSKTISQDYLQSFNQITSRLSDRLNHEEWVELYRELVRFDLNLDGDDGVRQILEDQYREANRIFGKYIESSYEDWIADSRAPDRPLLSQDVVAQSVLPIVGKGKPVVFFVIDCMRYDQWLMFEQLLFPHYEIATSFYYSLLPTATPYSRNAIFSGMLPSDMARKYPKLWADGEEDEHSRNRDEELLLSDNLKRHNVNARVKYDKLIGSNDGRDFAQNVHGLADFDLSAIVVNFVDILAHSRSDSAVLKEIAPDEKAYRALTQTWFEHSWLFQALQTLKSLDAQIVLTTDHGAIRSLHPTKVIGDRQTSTALRYKYGKSLKADKRHAIFVKDPETFGLPGGPMNTNYIIAKEDYYFVYPTNYNQYSAKYKDSLQHGGASLEEMILPIVRLKA
ncbi:MAG: response regulator, partial [Rhodothermales bacterium]|nr:response regulator [Rhodothermales bacterium]